MMDRHSAREESPLTCRIPQSWLKIHYYEAFSLIFRIENSLRVFVYSVLKSSLGDKWKDIALNDDEQTIGTLSSVAKRRLQQEMTMGYISYQINCPVMQLTAGELIHLILEEKNWPYFKSHFSGSKDVISYKLSEVLAVRNALAHFRPIRQDDVEILKQNAKQLFTLIGEYFRFMTSFPLPVPTNCEERWYDLSKGLESESLKIRFLESENAAWVELLLSYQVPVITGRQTRKRTYGYRLLDVRSPAILDTYDELRSMLVYMTENIPFSPVADPARLSLSKNISMVFNRETLRDNPEPFAEAVSKIVTEIDEETRMISDDPYARGRLVHMVKVLGRKHQDTDSWYVNTGALKAGMGPEDPVEYWGDIDLQDGDLISDAIRFPWMPVDIANEDDDPVF